MTDRSRERAEELERRLEYPLLAAALLALPTIVLEGSTVGEPLSSIATALNWVIWLAFLVAAAGVIYVSPDRWAWVRGHPLDVAIVVLTPPILPSALQAARVFRLLRLLRLFKAASLTRRLLSTDGIRDAAVLALVTILAGGAGFAAVEKAQHLSAWDGVWWAMTTVTTVGYGDIRPETDAGRAIAVVVMTAGIGFVALITAAAADRFIHARAAERSQLEGQLDEISQRLAALERKLP